MFTFLTRRNKQSECKAVGLLVKMANTYGLWLNNAEAAEKPFQVLTEDIFTRLLDNYYDSNFDKYRDEYKPSMEKMDKAVMDAFEGKTKFVRAMEELRTTMHKNPGIRQMFTSGEPYKPNAETKLSQEVLKALEMLENAEPGDAEESLEGLYGSMTCTKFITPDPFVSL